MIGQVRINNFKYDIMLAIREIVDPLLWESGFIKNSLQFNEEKVYTKIYIFGNKLVDEDDEDGDIENIAFEDEDLNIRVEGFTDEGVITEAWMGLCFIPYDELMLEQLLFAYQIAKKHAKRKEKVHG